MDRISRNMRNGDTYVRYVRAHAVVSRKSRNCSSAEKAVCDHAQICSALNEKRSENYADLIWIDADSDLMPIRIWSDGESRGKKSHVRLSISSGYTSSTEKVKKGMRWADATCVQDQNTLEVCQLHSQSSVENDGTLMVSCWKKMVPISKMNTFASFGPKRNIDIPLTWSHAKAWHTTKHN